jgi:hypothetical protein
MSKIEEVEGGDINTSSPDVEKMPASIKNTTFFGDQIPHEMLEELAPNGETEYILDKINNMTEEEAIKIIKESRELFPLA